MSYHRCFLQLGSSIRRCDNFVDNDNFFFCHKHLKTKLTDYKNKITLYNGVKCVFIDDKTITSSSKVNYLHLKYNRALNPIKAVLNNGKYVIVEKKKKLSYSEEYYLIKNCSLIKKGSVNNVINAIKRENIKNLLSKSSIIDFFNKKYKNDVKNKDRLITRGLNDARHFIGIYLYYKNNEDELKKLQNGYRNRRNIKKWNLKYQDDIKKIRTLQIYCRYKLKKKKCPISCLKKQYYNNYRNLYVIKRLQRIAKKNIKYKIDHSHGCPYTLEEYKDIPEKYRVCYKYTEGKKNHWRYYNIKWLNNDWLTQCEVKRFVLEPSTKKEFSHDFVEKVAKKMWYLSRIENDYDLLNDDNKTPYVISKDWNGFHKRRSLYSYLLLVYDTAHLVGMNINDIYNLNRRRKIKQLDRFYFFIRKSFEYIKQRFKVYRIIVYDYTLDQYWNSFYSNVMPGSGIDIISSYSIYVFYMMIMYIKNHNENHYSILKRDLKHIFSQYIAYKSIIVID